MVESVTKVWQLPYVNVFKHFKIDQQDWSRAYKEGDVSFKMDKTVKCTVVRITGSVPASNYIQFPKKNSQSIGLTGTFLYIQFRPIPSKYFVFHIEAVTSEDLVVRISVSNLFKEFKCTSTWIQFPYSNPYGVNSVEAVTSSTNPNVPSHNAATPQNSKWTFLCMNVKQILANYVQSSYSYTKTIQLCSNMYVRNVFTSDTDYDPEVSFRDAQKMSTGLNKVISPIPREMAFPVPKDESWNELYCYQKIPSSTASLTTPFETKRHESSKGRSATGHSDMNSASCRRRNMIDSIPFKLNQQNNKLYGNASGAGDVLEQSSLPAKPTNTKAIESVHIYPSIDDHSYKTSDAKIVTSDPIRMKLPSAPNLHRPKHSSNEVQNPSSMSDRYGSGFKSSLKPDPIVEMSRIIGSTMHRYPNSVAWASNGQCIVYGSNAVIVCLDIVGNGAQKFFVGHTDVVSCLCVNTHSTILASGQGGAHSIVRLWKFSSAQLITLFKAPGMDLVSLQFSRDYRILCSTGKDSHKKSVIALWDCSTVLKSFEVTVLVKVHADVDIASFKLNHFNPNQMVSCGRENIRFWRFKQKALRSCPVVLGSEYSTHVFTDIAYSFNYNDTKELIQPRVVYCCSSSGFVFEIDTEGVAVRAIKKLVQSLDRERVVSLTTLKVTPDYYAVGSQDGFLRVWSTDFSAVLFEFSHDSAEVVLVEPNDTFSKILCVTSSNQMGILDLMSHKYKTYLSCHTHSVVCCAVDEVKLRMLSCSQDHHINLWDLVNGSLIINFYSPSGSPTRVAFHPTREQWFVCGFDSGSIKLFDMSASASCIHEFNSVLRGSITGLVCHPFGQLILASCSSGMLASFSVSQYHFDVVKVLNSALPKGSGRKSTLALSRDGLRCSFIGPSEYVVSVVDSESLEELLRIDITQINTEHLSKGIIERGSIVKFSNDHLMLVSHLGNIYFLDIMTGKRLRTVGVHKEDSCTALEITPNQDYFFTAGDSLLKVWDYKLRFDVNSQTFIGHTGKIRQIIYVASSNSLVSIGDHVCIWRLKDSTPIVSSQTTSRAIEKVSIPKASASSSHTVAIDTFTFNGEGCTERERFISSENPRESIPIPTPAATIRDLSSIMPHEDSLSNQLEVLDLTNDDDDGELEIIDCGNGNQARSNLREFSAERDSRNQHSIFDKSERNIGPDPLVPPTCFKHFKRKQVLNKCEVAPVHYAAPENQAGLHVKSMIAFNGNGRDNIAWKTDPGLLYYTCGIVIVIEDLASSKQQILKGHVSEVSTFDLDPSGKYLASASGSNDNKPCQIIIWDLENCCCHKIVSHHKKDVISLKYSHDGNFLLSLGDYQEPVFVIWDSQSMEIVVSSKLDFVATAVAWDLDSPMEFCIVGENCSVRFWILEESVETETVSGKLTTCFNLSVHSSDTPIEIQNHRCNSASAAFGTHSFVSLAYAGLSILYIGSDQGIVSAWDTRSNKCYMHWVAGHAEITYITALGSRLITGSEDKKLKLWTVMSSTSNQPSRSSSETGRFPGNGLIMEDEYTLSGSITGGSFDHNLELGLVGTSDCLVWYINWLERNTVRLVNGHKNDITSTVFCGDDTIAVAASDKDGGIQLFSVGDNELIVHFRTSHFVTCLAYFQTVTSKQHVLKRLVAGFEDGNVSLFDIKKSQLMKTVSAHSQSVSSIAISPDNNYFLSGSVSGSVAIVDISSFVISRMLSDHKTSDSDHTLSSSICDVTFSNFLFQEKRYFAISSKDRRISIWQSNWAKERCVLCDWITFGAPSQFQNSNSDPPPTLVKFSPTEKYIVLYTGYTAERCSINFYNMSERKVIRQIEVNCYPTFLSISPKGNLICMGTENWLLKLIDYNEGSFQDFLMHSGTVRHLDFSKPTVPLSTLHNNNSVNIMLVSAAENEVVLWTVAL